MGFFRWLGQAVLFVLLLVVVPLAVIGLWVRVTVLDTDRYVETVAPLSSEPAVQAEVSKQIMGFLDGLASTADTGSSARNRLVRSAYEAVRGDIEQVVGAVLTSEEFGQGWTLANRDVHEQLVELLTGDLPEGSDGTIRLDLMPVFLEAKAELAARGVTVLNDVEPDPEQLALTLLEGKDLQEYRRYVSAFEFAVFVLAIAAVVLALVYVWGAKSTLLGIAGLFIVVAVAMAVIWLAIGYGREATVEGIADEGSRAAAGAIYDGVVARLRDRSAILAPVGLGAAVVFWLIHRSRRKPVYLR